MGPSRLFLWLFVLSILESTWARALSEVSGANRARGHWRKIGTGDETIGSRVIDDRQYYRDIVRRYIEERADGSSMKDAERIERKSRSLVGNAEKRGIPYSEKRWQKMLDKAIFKIIMGDLSTADILLLKSLNYNLEEVLAIREREFAKKMSVSERTIGKTGNIDRDAISGGSSTESYRSNYLEDKADRLSSNENRGTTLPISSTRKQNSHTEKIDDDFDFEAYNRQAVYDYENTASNASQQSELEPIPPIVDPVVNVETVESDDDIRKNFDRAMESHVVFKIRYDDSEFDSRSEERSRQLSRERDLGSVRGRPHYDVDFPGKSRDASSKVASEGSSVNTSLTIGKPVSSAATDNRRNDTFLESTDDLRYSMPLVYRLSDLVKPTEAGEETTIGADLLVEDRNDSSRSVKSVAVTANASSSEVDELNNDRYEEDRLVKKDRYEDRSVKNDLSSDNRRVSAYEGLEWVEDDVYRVIPGAADALDYDGNAIYLEKISIENDDGNETRGIGIDPRIGNEDNNDTTNYQNEQSGEPAQSSSSNSSARNQSSADLSAYQQLAMAHRRE